MDVILLTKVANLGNIGDRVKVKSGYVRNFLLPKGKATLSHISGVVRIAEDEGRGRVITVVADDGTEHAYTVPTIARLEVTDGQEISAGDPIVDGPRDPKELVGPALLLCSEAGSYVTGQVLFVDGGYLAR